MAGQGKGVLRIAIEDFIETFDLGKTLWKWQKTVLESLEAELLDMYTNLFNRFEYKEFMPEMFTPSAIGSMHPKQPVQIIPILLGLAMMAIGFLMGMVTPLQRIGSYKVDAKVKSYRPSPLEIFAMLRRLGADINGIIPALDDLGVAAEFKEGYKMLSEQLLSGYEYIAAYRRGKQDEAELNRHLKALGYEDREIDLLLNITLVIPGVQDLIRMAVREAFSPDVIAKFQYGEAFPEDVLEHTRKIGLLDEWVRRYWYAHWELPSPQMGYEMLHRLRQGRTETVFTEDDLDLLLRTADFAPYFRPRMKAISYNPITRVDIRRIYKLGLFDAEEVKQRYMDIGYTDADAQVLADFTVKLEDDNGNNKLDKYKELSLSTLKSLYLKAAINEDEYKKRIANLGYDETEAKYIIDLSKLDSTDDLAIDWHKKFVTDMITDLSAALANRMITAEQAKTTLIALGISDVNAQYIIDKQEYDASLSDLNDNLKYIKDAYTSGAMDRNTMVGELGRLGITGIQQNKLIEDLELALKYRNRRLTEAEYRKAWLADIITVEEYIYNLTGLGYTDYDINILVQLYTPAGA